MNPTQIKEYPGIGLCRSCAWSVEYDLKNESAEYSPLVTAGIACQSFDIICKTVSSQGKGGCTGVLKSGKCKYWMSKKKWIICRFICILLNIAT